MPSPLAHASVALVLWPMVRDSRASRCKRWILAGLLLAGVLGADLDIAVGVLMGEGAFAQHGGAWHSFAAGVVFATVFACIGSRLCQVRVLKLWLVGATAWWSHIVLDMFTPGRGVTAFWPLSEDRISAPLTLFYGVRHSEPLVLHHHALTVLTEMPFVILMWAVGIWLSQRIANANAYRVELHSCSTCRP